MLYAGRPAVREGVKIGRRLAGAPPSDSDPLEALEPENRGGFAYDWGTVGAVLAGGVARRFVSVGEASGCTAAVRPGIPAAFLANSNAMANVTRRRTTETMEGTRDASRTLLHHPEQSSESLVMLLKSSFIVKLVW